MISAVQILDETTTDPDPTLARPLDFEADTVTACKLIGRRVYERCAEYNADQKMPTRIGNFVTCSPPSAWNAN